MKSFSNDIRLINYDNQWHTTPIRGWTKEDGLVILETEHLHKPNIAEILLILINLLMNINQLILYMVNGLCVDLIFRYTIGTLTLNV